MSLASELISVLDKFRSFVAEHTNSGQLVTLDDHIDRVRNLVDTDVDAADAKAKDVLAELYGALHGAPAPVDAPPAPPATPAPVAADPVPAPAPAAPADPEPEAAPVEAAQDPQPESATAAAEPEATA